MSSMTDRNSGGSGSFGARAVIIAAIPLAIVKGLDPAMNVPVKLVLPHLGQRNGHIGAVDISPVQSHAGFPQRIVIPRATAPGASSRASRLIGGSEVGSCKIFRYSRPPP